MEGKTEKKSQEICKFYQEGKCRFGEECFNLHKGPVSLNTVKKKKSPKRDENGQNVEKKAKRPMKTAEDVIRRIQWDEMFPPEFFVVGYLDRFEGIVEDDFTKFSNWGNLSSTRPKDQNAKFRRLRFFHIRR